MMARVKASAESDRWVMLALVLGGTLVVLGMLASVVFLVWKERDANDILALVNLLVSGTAVKAAMDARSLAAQVKDQTNGTLTTLINKKTTDE